MLYAFAGVLAVLLFSSNVIAVPKKGPWTPLVLVPGDGGSQLMAKLNGKPNVVHYVCSNFTEDYYPLWLNIELLTPYILDCTVDNLRLVYDPVSKKTFNSPGVDIKVPNFGSTESVEWLDVSHISYSSYFAPLVETLVNLGYKRGKSVMGAPYDFRRAPDEMGEYYANLTALIESSFRVNGQKCVVLAHSLGNMIFTYFLSTKSQEWKDMYIESYVALAAPLGGAGKLWRLFASGDTLGERFVSGLSVRPMQRTFPSSALLLPYEHDDNDSVALWDRDHVFVITPNRNYTMRDYAAFAKDIGFPYMYDLRKNTKSLVNVKKVHPGVPVYCIHGWNVSTPEVFTYTGDMFPDDQPNVQHSNGDGTVNDKSLLACEYWKNEKYNFEHYFINGEDGGHLQILNSKNMINRVVQILQK